jgi:hypothetical protein
MDEHSTEDRFAALEARIARLEDELAVHRLLNTWGPAVDTANGDAAAALWDDDGVMEANGVRVNGPADVSAIVGSEGQRDVVRQGCAHVPSYPVVTVDGDRATATGYMRAYRRTDDGYEIWMVSAGHWEFIRTPGGWRMERSVGHLIDGGPEATAILARALDGGAAPAGHHDGGHR